MSVQIKGVGTIGGLDEGLNITGIVTATSFVGGLPITNGADNRVITASSASTLEAESTLTFSSRRLTSGGLTLNDDGVGGAIFQLYADDHIPWGFNIGNTTYHASTGLFGQQANNGDFLLRMVGNSEYKSFVIEQHNGSSNRSWIELGNGGNVNLYYQGSKKYESQEVGANFYGRSVDCQLRLKTSDGTTRGNIYAYNDNSIAFLDNSGNYSFRANSDKTVTFFNHGLPNANNSYDLGSTSHRWRNIYTNDLNLSNEGSSNDVDGTWGNYTIQEGEDDLFLINRRNGKKYKFNLTEVS